MVPNQIRSDAMNNYVIIDGGEWEDTPTPAEVWSRHILMHRRWKNGRPGNCDWVVSGSDVSDSFDLGVKDEYDSEPDVYERGHAHRHDDELRDGDRGV